MVVKQRHHTVCLRVLLAQRRIDRFRQRLVDSTKDESRREMTARFIRKGQTGDYKNHFSPELEEKCNEWIKRKMEGTDIVIPFPK